MDGELLAVLKWTAVYTGFTFLCTAAGAAAVFFLKPDAKTELAETLSLGFAAGIMTAASVWSLIIPAQEMAQKQGDTPWLIASLGIAAGAGFLKLLDAVLPHLHPGASKPEGPKTKMHRAMLLFLAITLHNIPEGGSVGLRDLRPLPAIPLHFLRLSRWPWALASRTSPKAPQYHCRLPDKAYRAGGLFGSARVQALLSRFSAFSRPLPFRSFSR